MDAAIGVFSEKGIEKATVEEIAARADVGKGTIYNYFETKEEIVVAFMVELESKVQRQVGRLTGSSGNLASILTSLLRHQFRLKEQHHEFVRVLLAQMYTRGKEFFPWVVAMQKVIDPPLERLFSELQQRGAVRKDVNIPDLIVIFKMMHLGLTSTWVLEGPPWRETNRLMKEQMRLLSEGLEARQ